MMIKKACFVGLSLIVLAAPYVLAQESILIKNGTIVPVVGETIDSGSLLIQDGKIIKVGKNLKAPANAKIIDARGLFVYPGIVATLTAVGVTGYPGAGNDQNEIGVVTPHMDPYDAINPEDSTIEVTRIAGVTTVQTISGMRNVINGKSVVLNLEGDLAPDMVIKRDAAQIFNMGAKRQNTYPTTLPGAVALIKDKLNTARRYAEKKTKSENSESDGNPKKGEPFKINLEMEALIPVIKGEVPALFFTHNDVTIRNALSIIKEYNLKGIIQASQGIHKYIDQLAAEKIPVIWTGTTSIPQRWEAFDLYYRTAHLFSAKGILFSYATSGFGGSSHNVRIIPRPAALSVAHGLSEKEAIQALTINPAKILGIDHLVGSLEAGKIANVVIWTGSPIQMSSRVQTVVINGKIIPMTSVQTRLRDKYEKIVKKRTQNK
jgi:imidazolonepropionase-like amidohydrolase